LRPTAPLDRKAHGLTANDLREQLNRLVREAYGDDHTDLWVRDYADEWVVFEAYGADTDSLWQQDYTVTDGVAELTGSPMEVAATTTYEPITAPPVPTLAPAGPAKSAGTPLASNVVAAARLRAQHALVGLPD